MFFRIASQVSITILKLAILLGILGAALATILWPAFLLAASIHWSLGLTYGVVSFVLVSTLLIVLLQRAKSERPIWDWLERS